MKNIEKKAPDLFARHGLDDDSFVDKCILPALFANETKFFQHEGKVTDSRDVIAWVPRTNTNALVARMKGMIREPDAAGTQNVKVVIIHSGDRPPRRNQDIVVNG